MITAIVTPLNQTSFRWRKSIDRRTGQRRKAESDDRTVEVALVAPQDPDALPGRGRWADCY
jgi:hypothetical protein